MVSVFLLRKCHFISSLHKGTAIINLRKTWEKVLLAARVIATIENPADICVISNGNFGQVCQNNFLNYH